MYQHRYEQLSPRLVHTSTGTTVGSNTHSGAPLPGQIRTRMFRPGAPILYTLSPHFGPRPSLTMIRSRNIPPLLSRITGDGINAALLVTADGELLGSSSDAVGGPSSSSTDQNAAAAAPQPVAAAAASISSLPEDHLTTGSNPNAPSDHLDYSAIGALVAEVAADYRRLGTELNHLDPHRAAAQQQAPPPPPPPPAAASTSPPGIGSASTSEATSPGSAAGSAAVAASKGTENNKGPTNGLRCMIVEMGGGTIGVSSAGSECYVVALADTTVEHGMLRARLTALSDHVAEAFSQL